MKVVVFKLFLNFSSLYINYKRLFFIFFKFEVYWERFLGIFFISRGFGMWVFVLVKLGYFSFYFLRREWELNCFGDFMDRVMKRYLMYIFVFLVC